MALGPNSLLTRMASGIPGDISRRANCVVEPVVLDSTNPFPGYGLAGKTVNGKFVPLAAGDTAASVTGVFVRPFPIQTSNAAGTGVAPFPIGDRMRRGYMTVKNNAGTPTVDGQVYVRVANPATGKPIGGFEAAADGTNNVALTDVAFTNVGDANGNTEIRYRV